MTGLVNTGPGQRRQAGRFCHFYSGSGQTADGPVPAGLQYALIVAILKEDARS